jgi:Domain of unknown function (DUF6249)
MTRIAQPAPPLSRTWRRFALGTALLLAIAVWQAPTSAPAQAQQARPPAGSAPEAQSAVKPAASSEPKDVDASISIKPGSIEIKAPSSTGAKVPAENGDVAGRAERTPGRTITIEKGNKRIQVVGLGNDKEYDSFGQFVHDDPALAWMVVAIVAVVFLSPVLAIALVLGYRMRKARMLNETMLKLAEKGLAPPAEALGALSGSAGRAIAASPAVAPFYEQAKQMRRHAAWSDLRKGVIMGSIGLGLTLYSYLDDHEANGLGLVLLFVGIGYALLWWFEQRQIGDAGAGTGSGAASGGSAPGGSAPGA